MPAGPAMLAQQTGALLLPVTLWYEEPPVMGGREENRRLSAGGGYGSA